METLFLMIDTVTIVLILFYSMKNDKLRPGTPEIGFFRMSEPKQRKKQEVPVRQLRGRNL